MTNKWRTHNCEEWRFLVKLTVEEAENSKTIISWWRCTECLKPFATCGRLAITVQGDK